MLPVSLQYAQTSVRDVIGQGTLDQLLTEREQIAKAIEAHVERDTKGWGLDVTGLRIQDVDMPEELKKMMSRQASAEREKRATITKAEGDKEASLNLAAAARTMAESPGAMQLPTLQTIDGLGPTASNTVLIDVPVELIIAGKSTQKSSQDGLSRPAKIGDTDSHRGRTISYSTAGPAAPGTGFRSARRSVPATPSSGRR